MKKMISCILSAFLVFAMLFSSSAFADSGGEAWFSEIKNSMIDSFNGADIRLNEDVKIKIKADGLSKTEAAATKAASVILKINTEGEHKLFGFSVKCLGISLLSGSIDRAPDGSVGIYVPRLSRSYYKLTPELTGQLLSDAAAEMGFSSWSSASEWIKSLTMQQTLDMASQELGTDLSGVRLTASVTYPSSAELPDSQPVSVATMGELNIVLNSISNSLPAMIAEYF